MGARRLLWRLRGWLRPAPAASVEEPIAPPPWMVDEPFDPKLDLYFAMSRTPTNQIDCTIFMVPDSPGAVGVLLADALRHFALAIEKEQGIDKNDATIQIWRVMQSEMGRPTGQIQDTTPET